MPCWQRACITLPWSPGPCSRVDYITGSAVATLRVASLLPAHLGPNPRLHLLLECEVGVRTM